MGIPPFSAPPGLSVTQANTYGASPQLVVPTQITANTTGSTANLNQNLQNSTATNLVITPTSGQGNFSYSQTGTGTVSLALPQLNLVQYSYAIENAYWNLGSATVTATSGVTDPFGGTNARTVSCASATLSFIQILNPISTIGQQYSFSIWVQGIGPTVGSKVTLGNFNNNTLYRQQKVFTLTSSWQQIFIQIAPSTATGNNLYLDLLDSYGANIPSGNTLNVYGAWLTPNNNNAAVQQYSYVATNGTAVTTPAYIVEGAAVTTSTLFNQVNVVENPTGTFQVSYTPLSPVTSNSFSILPRGPRRQSTIVIGASTTNNPADSDYVCTGTADDVAITNAISSLNNVGGKVLLRQGVYMTTSAIGFDASWVTLEGESRGFWNAFYARWPTPSLRGTPGGVQIYQQTSGANGITITQNNLNTMINRHNGVSIRNLYLYSLNGNGTAILDAGNTDISSIEHCAVHNFNNGFDLAWDTPSIKHNSVQSCSGTGLVLRFVFGTVYDNIFYDIGGHAIGLATSFNQGGTKIIGNTIGSCATSLASAIYSNTGNNTIIGNTITGVNTGSCIEITGTGSTNNTISGNVLSIDNTVGLATAANTAGHGIYIHNGSYGNSITGNTINQTTTGTCTGYAVALGASSDTTAINNVVSGNAFTGGKWNSATGVAILDNSGGTTNNIGTNFGDAQSGRQYSGENIVASSSTPAFSNLYAENITILTANATFSLPAGTAGQEIALIFVQNATGGFTVTAPSNVIGFFTVGTTANKRSIQTFSYSVSLAAWVAQSVGVINV